MTKQLPPGATPGKVFKIKVPDDFLVYRLKKTDSNTVIECKNLECEFTARSDRVNCAEDLNHDCPLRTKRQTTLDNMVVATPKQERKLASQEQQKELMFNFAAMSNCSMEVMTSDHIHNLLINAFMLGQQNPNAEPSKVLYLKKRTQFTKDFIAHAQQRYNEILDIYKEYKYIALAIDAGKEQSTHYLDIMICNALLDVHPLIFKSIRHFRGTEENYVKHINDAIVELQQMNFIVTGIVSDNLRVQVSAISRVQSKFPHIKHIPCGCHTLALAIKDLKSHEKWSRYFEDLKEFISIFSISAVIEAFGPTIPRLCDTRWTNIFDICEWIVDHTPRFMEFFADDNTYNITPFKYGWRLKICYRVLTKVAPIFFTALLPFKILSMKLESDRCTCSYIWPATISAFSVLQQLNNDVPFIEEFAIDLLKAVHTRLMARQESMFLRLIAALSPAGRELEMLTKDNRHNMNNTWDKAELYAHHFPLEIDPRQRELIVYSREIIATKSDKFQKLESKLDDEVQPQLDEIDDQNLREMYSNQLPPHLEPSAQEEQVIQAMTELERTIDPNDTTDDQPIDTELDRLLEYQAYLEFSEGTEENIQYLTTRAAWEEILDEVRAVARSYGLNPAIAETQFTNFVQNPSAIPEKWLDHFDQNDLYGMWNHFKDVKGIEVLAEIALRLLSIPASEAAVERLFWKLKRIVTNDRTRTGSELEIARLTYSIPLPSKEKSITLIPFKKN